MTFTEPVPYSDALARLASEKGLPADLKSWQIQELVRRYPELMRQAFFSARTTDFRYLNTMQSALADLVDPATARRAGRVPSRANFRVAMRDALAQIGYTPGAAGVPDGSIEDLGSDARLDLIVTMKTEMAWGAGSHQRAQLSVDAYPCQELIRAEERVIHRDWPTRWMEAARTTGDLDAARVLSESGRMVARKDSDIWTAISRFGLPYPPFDYNSGMWTIAITRSEAVSLGAIEANDVIEPSATRIPEEMSLGQGESGSQRLLQALSEVLGPEYSIEGGVLRRVA